MARLIFSLVVIRLFLGYWFLSRALSKVGAGFLSRPTLQGMAEKWASDNPLLFYKSFLTDWVIPNSELFSYLVVYGEALVGLTLILGLATRFSAFVGALMVGSYGLAKGWWPGPAGIDKAFLAMLAATFIGAAGRYGGLDALLKKRYPRLPLW